MKKVLVTGGCGFIGSNFIRYFMQKNPAVEIVNLDKLTYAGRKENLQDIEGNEKYTFIQGDICIASDVEKAMQGCDSVLNFAAESHVDRSIEDADAFVRTNFFGVKQLCEEARKKEVKKFVQVSSVTGDTPILVRRVKDRKIDLIQIEALGQEKISEYEVLTLDDDYKATFRRMEHFIKHPSDEIFRIHYRGGGIIKATASHSLFVFENGEIVAKQSKELKEGDNLITFLGNINNQEKKIQEFSFREVMGDYTTEQIEKAVENRKHILAILAERPQKWGALKKKINASLFIGLKSLMEGGLIEKNNKTYFITPRGKAELKTGLSNTKWQLVKNKLHIKKDKMEVSQKLMKIFGYYLAEGHSAHTKKELERHSNEVIFTFSLKEKKNVKEIKEFFKKEFGVGTYIAKRKESIQISINSELAHQLFGMFGSTAYTKKIPHWVWNQPKESVKSFIKGYECDAAIKKDGRRHFTSVNKNLITSLIWLMRYNNINCSYLERLVKNNNPPHAVEIKDLHCYDILVSAENEFDAEASSAWRTPMARCLPPEALLADRNPKTFGNIYLDKRKMISKQRLQTAYEKQKPNATENELKFIYSDIGIAKIKRIEREKGAFMVYDVSIPGNEKFFGGNTPVLLHNTDEVYGQVVKGSSKETDALKPRNPYSAAKAAGELLAMSYFNTYGLPVLVTRSSNNYGPFQFPEKVIPLFITNLLQNKKVPLYGEGKNVRDWLFVLDNCEAIGTVLQKGKLGGIYNIGGNHEMQNIELTKAILKELGKGEEMIQRVTDRLGHDLRYSLDCSKIESELGWKPKTKFEEGLKNTVQWYKENEARWKPLVKGGD